MSTPTYWNSSASGVKCLQSACACELSQAGRQAGRHDIQDEPKPLSRHTNRHMHTHTDRKVQTGPTRQTDTQIQTSLDKQTDTHTQMQRSLNRQARRQARRQADRHTQIQTSLHSKQAGRKYSATHTHTDRCLQPKGIHEAVHSCNTSFVVHFH